MKPQPNTLWNNRSVQSGFTLIEVAIVIVITGLLIGFVSAGMDLVSAARTQKQTKQIDQFRTATMVFREKYGYLPGDIPDPRATQFGLVARAAGAGRGDGNGVVDFPTGVNMNDPFAGEHGVFWRDLNQAGLLDGSYTWATALRNNGAGLTESSNPGIKNVFPKAAIDRGYVIISQKSMLSGMDRSNYFVISHIVSGSGSGIYTKRALTVAQAFAIDSKTDDGNPQHGRVQARTPLDAFGSVWASGGAIHPGPFGQFQAGAGDYDSDTYGAITPSTTNPVWAVTTNGLDRKDTCYNNGTDNVADPEHYSMEFDGGSGLNCDLSIEF